jgi:hypothetical protein
MRLLFVLVLAVFTLAYVMPTESLDTFYWAQPGAVSVVGLDGKTLWSQNAMYPLIATDRAGEVSGGCQQALRLRYADLEAEHRDDGACRHHACA